MNYSNFGGTSQIFLNSANTLCRSHKGLTGNRIGWPRRRVGRPNGMRRSINEHPNALIAWRSKEGSEIENAGSVRFEFAPAGQGTEVTVTLEYRPPVGALGVMVARMYGEEPERQVEEDLMRFKALMELGDIPTTEGQPCGPKHSVLRKK